MTRRPLLCLAAVVAGCTGPEHPAPTAPANVSRLTPSTVISDARSGGDSHFYWLPPIAPATTYPGTFDAIAQPELRICPFANNACTAAATIYTRSSVPAIAVGAQSFALDWSTKAAGVGVGDYRAEVRLAARVLGVADVRVVGNAKDLKSVPAGFVGVQDGKTLSIAFRIETGIVGQVRISPRDSVLIVGATRQYSATVRDIYGAIIPGAAVIWSTRNPSIATVSASGVVTGAATGATRLIASSGGVMDSMPLFVRPVPVARVAVSPAGVVSLNAGQQLAFSATTYDASDHVLTGRTVTWSTNNAAVVTIGPDGLATATGPGISFIVATSEGKRDSTFVDVPSGAAVTCLRPWTVPEIWFVPNVVGRQVTAHYGAIFGSVTPTSTSGAYYPLVLGGASGAQYLTNIVSCSPVSLATGDSLDIQSGNLVGPTTSALDSLFKLDPNATWDQTANGGVGGVVGSNAAPGTESARVVQVALYIYDGQSLGASRVAVRRTAYVFVESYVAVSGSPAGLRGDITFRFLRFGP